MNVDTFTLSGYIPLSRAKFHIAVFSFIFQEASSFSGEPFHLHEGSFTFLITILSSARPFQWPEGYFSFRKVNP